MLVSPNPQPQTLRASRALAGSARVRLVTHRGAVPVPCLPRPSVRLAVYRDGYTALVFPYFFFEKSGKWFQMSFKREYRRRIGFCYIVYLRGILTFIPEESLDV